MFTHAIAITPAASLRNGLRAEDHGMPDHATALVQHAAYVEALERCGLSVRVLPADERYPDSTFIEDTALVTPRGAILTHPGAPSRRGEVAAVADALHDTFGHCPRIEPPATVDAGDIATVGDHYFIGLSERTSAAGAEQMGAHLRDWGFTSSTIDVGRMLHLKSGLSYLDGGYMVACRDYASLPQLDAFDVLIVDDDEDYAANCVWVNGTVLVPAGYPKAARRIAGAGYAVIELDMSEFRKVDGGLSCLSLRF